VPSLVSLLEGFELWSDGKLIECQLLRSFFLDFMMLGKVDNAGRSALLRGKTRAMEE